jgi:hypothetical protein
MYAFQWTHESNACNFCENQGLVGRRGNARTTMYDKTPESLCYMNQLKNMIFRDCIMLVSGRVLYLYAMCREDDSGGTCGRRCA